MVGDELFLELLREEFLKFSVLFLTALIPSKLGLSLVKILLLK